MRTVWFSMFVTSSAFMLPPRPQLPDILLTNKGMNAVMAQYLTAVALTEETAPVFRSRASDFPALPVDMPIDSITFVAFAALFAMGYAAQQLQSKVLR